MTKREVAEVRRQIDTVMHNGKSPRLRSTTVVLDADDLALLDELAAARGRSRSWLIRQAIRRTWLAGRGTTVEAASKRTPEQNAEWRRRLAAMDARIAARQPPDLSPEEIEADITAAVQEVRDEVRQERLAARSR